MPGSPAQRFSETAAGYAATMAPSLRPIAETVVRRARLRPGERVVDIGTGTGSAAAAARGQGRAVIGVDAAPGMLEIARREVAGVRFEEMDFGCCLLASDIQVGNPRVGYRAPQRALRTGIGSEASVTSVNAGRAGTLLCAVRSGAVNIQDAAPRAAPAGVETRRVRAGMKHRRLVGMLLVVAVALAACTPAGGGDGAGESAPAAPADYYDGY